MNLISVTLLLTCQALFHVARSQNGVGFTVGIDGPLALDGNIIFFNQEISNIGDLYSSASGAFTCPPVIQGLYHFQLTIKSSGLNVAEANILYRNGADSTETIIATVRTGDGLDMASNSATIVCGGNSGDQVIVRGVTGTILGDAGRGQNTFTGFGHRLI